MFSNCGVDVITSARSRTAVGRSLEWPCRETLVFRHLDGNHRNAGRLGQPKQCTENRVAVANHTETLNRVFSAYRFGGW